MIREHATVLLALFDARKENGSKYEYSEMLTIVGLSSTHDWVRALSKFFTANGKRRKVEYTWKRGEVPVSNTIPGVLDDTDPGVDPDAGIRQRLNNAAEAVAAAASRIAQIGDMLGCHNIRSTFTALFCDD